MAMRTSAPKPASPRETGSRAIACRSSQVAPDAATCALDVEIGPNGERHAPPALRVIEFAHSRRSSRAHHLRGRVEIRQFDVVRAAIDAVHHGIGGAAEFVVEAAGDETPDDRIIEAFTGKHIACCATLDATFGQTAMDALDDIPALAQLTQCDLGLFRQNPLAWGDLRGEAKGFELTQPANLQGMKFVGLAVCARRHVDHTSAITVARELAIKIGPALGLDLALDA